MKPILSCGLVLCLLLVLAACGGSSSTLAPPPNPNNVGFSNASLNGNYVFRVSGSRVDSTTGLVASFSAVGVFVADGNGHIISGQQDANDTVAGLTQVALTGTYTVGVDGRSQATFNFANGASTTFDFVLNNVTPGSLTPGIVPNGRIIGFTSAQVATGRLEKQDTTLASVNATYILRLDGSVAGGSGTLQPIARLGSLTISGGTASAKLDENVNGTFTQAPSAATTGNLGFTGVPSGGVGRGTITNLALASGGTTSLIFYAVNANRLEFIAMDGSSSVIGGADVQTAPPTVNGNYAFVISGLASFGNMAEAGVFTLNSGTLLISGLEDLPGGGPVSISGSYTGAASGRQQGSFTSTGRQVTFVMWFSDSNHGVLMTTNNDLLETGLVQIQPAIPTNATVNGNYALNLAGATFSGSLTLTGQVQSNGQGTLTGLEDFNLNGGLTVPTGASASGSYSFASNGRGTGTIGATSVVLYPADGNTIFVLTSDGNVVAGMLQAQH